MCPFPQSAAQSCRGPIIPLGFRQQQSMPFPGRTMMPTNYAPLCHPSTPRKPAVTAIARSNVELPHCPREGIVSRRLLALPLWLLTLLCPLSPQCPLDPLCLLAPLCQLCPLCPLCPLDPNAVNLLPSAGYFRSRSGPMFPVRADNRETNVASFPPKHTEARLGAWSNG